MIDPDRLGRVCPACGAAFREPEPEDAYFSHWMLPDFECTCKQCGWGFRVDWTGNIVDDGDLDDAGPFEVGQDDLDCDGDEFNPSRCPRCCRLIDGDSSIAVKCPWCQVVFCPANRTIDTHLEDDENDAYDNWLGCPNCLSDGDIDGEPMTAIGPGRVLCHRCGYEFDVDEDEAWQEPRDEKIRVTIGRRGGDIRRLDELPSRLYGVRKANVRLGNGAHAGGFDVDVPEIRIAGIDASESVRIYHCPRFFGAKVALVGLTLTDGASFNHCHVVMRDCIVNGPVDAINSEVYLHQCVITNAKGVGVAVYQGSRLHMNHTSISECIDAGLLIETGSTARLRHSRFLACQGNGICVRPSNWLVARHCEIRGNSAVGVSVQKAQAVVIDTEVIANARVGIEIDRQSRVFIYRSQVVDNVDVDVERHRPTLFAQKDCRIGSKRG